MKKQNILILTIALINAPLAADADVVVTAKTEGYSAFHDAVMSAGIYEHAKKNEGDAGSLAPFTVFVPTNEAFEAIKSLDAKKLKKYITYHVVPGKRLEKLDETMKDGVGTVGEKLLFSQNGELFLDESKTKAKVTKGPITASNGLIYVIDHVLLPAEDAAPAAQKPAATPAVAATPTPAVVAAPATEKPAATPAAALSVTPAEKPAAAPEKPAAAPVATEAATPTKG